MKNSKQVDLNDLRPKGEKIIPTSLFKTVDAFMMYEMIQELAAEMTFIRLPCRCTSLSLFRNGCQCGGK
jgi:hypothetical protein